MSKPNSNISLIPEWQQPKAIALVWPEHIGAGRGRLKEFYWNFIKLLSSHLHVKVLYSSGQGKFPVPKFLSDKSGLSVIQFREIGDIWIRDFGPFPVSVDDKIVSLKAKYKPGYHRTKAEMRDGNTDDKVGETLALKFYGKAKIYLKIGKDRLILDGGNLIHNGEGVAITTNRIITENEHVFIDKLRRDLKGQLGISELHIIPTEPGDDTGHADGMVRFLDSKRVIVTSYPYRWEGGKGYIDDSDYNASKAVVNSIADYFDEKHYTVFRMPCGIPLDSKDFESAVGNYTNFLRVGDTFFLPQYGNEIQDFKAKDALQKAGIKEDKLILVPDCTILANEGGVLNCITNHVY